MLVRASNWIEPRCDSTVVVISSRRSAALRVAERARQDVQLAGERLRVRQLAALFFLVGQHGQRRDADDRAVDDVAELVRAQDDVERLIPRHVAQRHVDGALNRRIDDDVQAADLGEGPQHRAQVGALEVEADRVARVARARRCGAARRPARPAPAVWPARLRLRQRPAARPPAAPAAATGARGRLERRDRIVDRLVEHDRQVVAVRRRLDAIGGRARQVHGDLRHQRRLGIGADAHAIDRSLLDRRDRRQRGRDVRQVQHQPRRAVFRLLDAGGDQTRRAEQRQRRGVAALGDAHVANRRRRPGEVDDAGRDARRRVHAIGFDVDDVARAAHARTHRLIERQAHARHADAVERPARSPPSRPRTDAAGRRVKPSSKPAVTTSRSSTTKVRASGCDATYGTGVGRLDGDNPGAAVQTRADPLEHRRICRAPAAPSGAITPAAMARHRPRSIEYRYMVTWPLPSVGASSALRAVSRARADR